MIALKMGNDQMENDGLAEVGIVSAKKIETYDTY
jgi:hypothetical protein